MTKSLVIALGLLATSCRVKAPEAPATPGVTASGPGVAARELPFDKVSLYFVGHEDDWFLFMNPPASDDAIASTTKSVFVHMTAGDAGLGAGTNGKRHPFYLARERGAKSAIRLIARASDQSLDAGEYVELNGHKVFRVQYNNSVGYFFRLPDGQGAGDGYEHTGFQTLKRLDNGAVKVIAAVDGSTTYQGWSDLVATLRALIDRERDTAPHVELHVADLDEARNPGDHSDHRMSARAALDAAADLTCARRLHFIEYAITPMPKNLSPEQERIKMAVYKASNDGLAEFDHPLEDENHYTAWLFRNYHRVEDGTGACTAPRR